MGLPPCAPPDVGGSAGPRSERLPAGALAGGGFCWVAAARRCAGEERWLTSAGAGLEREELGGGRGGAASVPSLEGDTSIVFTKS